MHSAERAELVEKTKRLATKDTGRTDKTTDIGKIIVAEIKGRSAGPKQTRVLLNSAVWWRLNGLIAVAR